MAKKKYQLEYPLNTSASLIWARVATPGGLSEWFADDVNLQGDVFTFFWNKVQQKAELIHKKDYKYVRFRWLDDEDDASYFEFRLSTQELTHELTLIVTDFSDTDDYDESVELWNSQINELKRGIGLLV